MTSTYSIRVPIIAAVWLAFASPASADRLVGCGQVFSGRGELGASCVGDIVVRDGALNLRGHVVRGTVQCEGEVCDIYSDPPNGRVQGFGEPGSVGIRAGAGAVEGAGSVTIDDVIVSGFATGVAAANVVLIDSLIAGNLGNGVDALMGIEAVDSIVSLNGYTGLHARLGGVSLAGAEVSENGHHGIRALTGVIATDSVISDNKNDGIQNFSAVALLVASTVTGNGGHGVRTDDSDCDPTDILEIDATHVGGNGLDPECGLSRPCADLVACATPIVSGGASCGTSHQMMSGIPGIAWGVCADD